MAPLRPFAIVLALVLAGAARAAPADDPPTTEILTRILTERDAAPTELFEVLARRDDDASQGALERAVSAVQSPESIDAAYAAFALYRDRGAREERAIAFLAGETRRPQPVARQSATRALVRFESDALAELREIVETHEDPECRRLAIGGILPALQIRGMPDDLELLLGWYAPPTSGTREAGVRALSQFRSESSLARLAEALADRDMLVSKKAMVLDALARIGGERAVELAVDALDAKQPGVCLAAIGALETLGHTEHLRKLRRLERDRDPAVRHAAFLAQAPLRRGDDSWAEDVLKAARVRDWARRMAAASALVGIGTEEATAALHGLLEDQNPLVRREAIRALATLRRKDSIELLVARMPAESLRNQDQVRAALTLLTGLDHGANPTRWARWWADEGAAFRIPPLDEARAAEQRRAREREARSTESSFYGIPLHSDRIAFVLDVSGSMSALAYAGGMRIDSVKKELDEVLVSLPDGAWFNLLFFDDRVSAWKRGLVEMDEDRRGAAREYARKQGPGGGTALYDGLEAAFEDPEVDTIVLLSDGEPTEGQVTDPREILERVEQWNVLREVVIHCVSVDWAGELLRDLARETGGTHIEVR